MASRMIQNNFSGGEISPTLFGRSDLQAYYKGCADAENFVIAKEGSLRKRHGITSIVELAEAYDNQLVVPYKFDRTKGGFLLLRGTETGSVEISFYDKDGAAKSTASVADAIDIGEGAKSIAEQIKSIQFKQIGDQVWLSNGRLFIYVVVTDNETISVKEWAMAEVPPTIKYSDTLDGVSTHWTIKRDMNRSGRTIHYGIIGIKDSVNSETSKGSCTWSRTWEASTWIDLHVTIALEDKKSWQEIIFCKRTGGTYGELTRVYMDDTPDMYLYTNGSKLAQAYLWEDGKFYNKSEGSSDAVEVQVTHHRYTFRDENHDPGGAVYGQTNVLGEGFTKPLCVDCYQQRRVFANASNAEGKYPMTLWFSETGNLNSYFADRPASDDDPFSPTIASTGPAFIRWVIAYQEMMVLLTDSGLYSVGFSQQSGFSASSCRISRFSELGVSPRIAPVVTDAGIVFVAGDNKTVYTAAYDVQENMLKPINRSVLVEHLTRTAQIKALALQSHPDNVVWIVTDDGKISTFTFERNEEVYAWSHCTIDGAKVLDVVATGTCTDSNGDRTYGDLIFVVERNGKQYVARNNSAYHDSIGGQDTNVRAQLVTLRPESQERTIVGLKKNIKDIIVRLYESGGIAAKAALGADLPLVQGKRDGSKLFTGDVKIIPRGYVNESGQMTLVSDNAEPCEILQIITELEVE